MEKLGLDSMAIDTPGGKRNLKMKIKAQQMTEKINKKTGKKSHLLSFNFRF
jgi:hypothetical protein